MWIYRAWSPEALGVVVAAASAVEGFFRFGERWQHYRRTAEALKAEFWRFSQLSGPYKDSPDHSHAFSTFVERVEHVLGEDLETYFAAIQPKADSAHESSPSLKSGEPGPHPERGPSSPKGPGPVTST